MKKLLTLTLLALSTFAFSTLFESKKSRVYINDIPVINLKTSKKGNSPSRRAKLIVWTLQRYPHKGKVTVSHQRQKSTIKIGKTVVIHVTPREAFQHRSTANKLAEKWASNIRRALKAPRFMLETKEIRIKVGQSKEIKLTGRSAKKTRIEHPNKTITSITRTKNGIKVLGIKPGFTTITVHYKGYRESFAVEVMRPEQKYTHQIKTDVGGYYVNSRTIKKAVKGAIRRDLSANPNAKIAISDFSTEYLGMKQSRTYRAKATITTPNAPTYRKDYQVQVRNVGVLKHQEKNLWYCNYPEKVEKTGFLGATVMKPNSPLRVLYHHINTSKKNLVVEVVIRNRTSKAAKIVMFSGNGKPDKDPVKVGFHAGVKFMKKWIAGDSEIIRIPPNSALPITLRKIKPQEVMSGVAYLRLLPNGAKNLAIVARATYPGQIPTKWKKSINHSTAWRHAPTRTLLPEETRPVRISKHLYRDPFRRIVAKYDPNEKYEFIRIGQEPIINQFNTDQLEGNFGVIYTIEAQMQNKGKQAVETDIAFEASAGYSGALFYVNNQLRKAPLMPSKKEYLIRKINLKPRQNLRMSIVTMPLSGSSYPATISIRPSNYGSHHYMNNKKKPSKNKNSKRRK